MECLVGKVTLIVTQTNQEVDEIASNYNLGLLTFHERIDQTLNACISACERYEKLSIQMAKETGNKKSWCRGYLAAIQNHVLNI